MDCVHLYDFGIEEMPIEICNEMFTRNM